jgi:hypothetical protein
MNLLITAGVVAVLWAALEDVLVKATAPASS